jgi:non-ribosomal peptide synthase protein (TIGR01720 family)
VLLDLGSADTPYAAVTAISEQVRRIPHRGAGYGILRYLSGDMTISRSLARMKSADVSFNYLGYSRVPRGARLGARPRPTGADPQLRVTLTIFPETMRRRMSVRFQYNPNAWSEASIDRVAAHYIDFLRSAIPSSSLRTSAQLGVS